MIDWSRIPQHWLRDAGKRWARVRATTLTLGLVSNDARRLARFGQFLASNTRVRWPRDLTREAVEAYLAYLAVEFPATERDGSISTLRRFLEDAADQGLLDLRRDARVRRTDHPRRSEPVPRFLPERVMAVVEAPESLVMLEDNGLRNTVKVLIGTGRRAQEVLSLPVHCVEEGPDGDPYLRFFSGKMAKEDLIPIDPATAAAIADQQALVLRRWPGGSRWLFPRPKLNPLGVHPFTVSTPEGAPALGGGARPPRAAAGQRAQRLGGAARGPHRPPVPAHNRDPDDQRGRAAICGPAVPRPPVGEDDRPIRRHPRQDPCRRLRSLPQRVTTSDELVVYQPDSPLTDGMRLAERLKRARQTLPNGYCARPLQTECIHPNFCIGCSQFASDVTFLPVLRGQRDRAARLEATCADEGRTRWAERNRRDIDALERIIDTLEKLPEAADFAP